MRPFTDKQKKKTLIVSKLKERAKKGVLGISGKKHIKKQFSSTKAQKNKDIDGEDYSDIEEEPQSEYCKGGYHRVKIGDTLKNNRYHIVSKLGWGYFSTVWLAFDCDENRFVALKITKSKTDYLEAAKDEVSLLTDLARGEGPGKDRIVQLFDHFSFYGPNGRHFCLVMEVIGDNMLSLIREYKYKGLGLTNKLLPLICKDVLMGTMYMHEQCKIIHTDLKPENILYERPKESVITIMRDYKIPPKSGVPLAQRDISSLTKKQLRKLRRKQKNGADSSGEIKQQQTTDANCSEESSQGEISNNEMNVSNTTDSSTTSDNTIKQKTSEEIVELEFTHDPYKFKIADFGNACWVKKHFTDDIQTRQYRSPEVITGASYSTAADIWSLACVFFELATGEYLFDPKKKDYGSLRYTRDEDHLAQMIELLGDMPRHLQSKGKFVHKFFNKNGELTNIKELKYWDLESVLKAKYLFEPEDARLFASFLLPMLQFDPAKRATAKQCLQHEFLNEERISKLKILSVEERLEQIPLRSSSDEESYDEKDEDFLDEIDSLHEDELGNHTASDE
jgi:serine/threonine-protein kinase SRPK3